MRISQLREHSLESYQLLRNAFVVIEGSARVALDAIELTPLQFDTLRVLELDAGQRMKALTFRLLCDDSTLTRVVDRLVAAGWAERNPDPSDRRASLIRLTPAGHTVHAEAAAAVADGLTDRFEQLSDDEQDVLADLLTRLSS